ncbi:MAG: ATP-binding protein [Rhodocyclaceae bacterium]
MKLVPRSLLARTFLLVSAVMLLSVLAWLRIYVAYEREPRARELAQLVVSVVNLTRAALVSARPERRMDLLTELNALEGIRIYPAEADDALAPPPETALLALVTRQVRQALGAGTRFALGREGEEGFWVSFRIDEDEYWLVLPGERLERIVPRQWIGWGAAALLLSLAAAYLIVFRVSRPLRRLSLAAAAIGRGEHPERLDERGPEEVVALAHAFNTMSEDLRALDEDRALILAGISHDLRTPLARLRLAIELSGADPETRAGMDTDIEEMDRVIGQFLDFARDTAGEAPQATAPGAIVEEVVERFRKREAAVSAMIAPAPQIPLRALAVRRMLTNLIENALRYGGGASVEVSLRRERDDLLLDVADRGPGIPPEQAERLKRPFTRLEAARSGQAGAGLGLAIVERIARAHGGRLDLLAREGGGLIARVRLPLSAAQPPRSSAA